MRIALVTNNNGIGLQIDAELLNGWLTDHGHQSSIYAYDAPLPTERFDLAILLEVCVLEIVNLAPRVWYFANPEWLKPDYVKFLDEKTEYIFAKTRAAERALKEKFLNVHYTGFLTRDQYKSDVPRQRKFLHIGGNGGFRNTQAVIDAWRSYRYWNGPEAPNADLTVVSNSNTITFDNCPGIHFTKRATDEEIRRLQNECIYHLYPSAYEGFGHALHEAQSVGAVLLTTAAPPMNEFGAAFHIPECGMKRKNFGELHEVSAMSIREAVPKMLALSEMEVEAHGQAARALFLSANREFGERFEPFLSPPRTLRSVTVHRPVVAVLGNLSAFHSTENDLVWTLKDMGCGVKVFQENEVTTEGVVGGCGNVSLLIYVHTHGWHTPGKMTVGEMIERLREKRVTTASFHLDRYWGLNKLDQREDKIGEHPFWKTDFVFTADGGGHDWKGRGVNHHWLPPAVVKRDCYLGERRGDLAVDVGFVGARAYHPEYPFRQELIEFLEGRYGERFRLFQGYRGSQLNDAYASISIVVGDSCFGGADRYWSDRVPETLGRGGFLVHPETPGLRVPGLVTFEPENLFDLAEKIDYYLENPIEREALSHAAFNWVQRHETYHNRMEVLLRVCGF